MSELKNIENDNLEKFADMYVDTENYISEIDNLISICNEIMND